jgi:N-acetylmuramoyl-L-alanine amidase
MRRRPSHLPRPLLLILVLLLALGAVAVAGRGARRLLGDVIGPVGSGSSGKPVAVDPSRFQAGACIAYPPLRGDRRRTVFLDAGHGGLDPGSVGVTESGRSITEASLTLPVELDAAALLRRRGFRVVVSRTRNQNVVRLTRADVVGNELSATGVHDDVAARDICANEAHADLLVGIYFDAGAPYNAGSVTGYDADRPFSAANLRFATLLQDDVLGAMNAQGWQIPSEGVQLDDQLGSSITQAAQSYGHLMELGPAEAGYFNTPSRMPGAIIEPLFITDPFEGSIADSVRGQKVIAAGIAQAVEQYFAAPRRHDSRH